MAKITQLTAAVPTIDDVIAFVDDAGGVPTSKKAILSDVLKLVYPVGCIYTSTVSTNPNTLFGFGTWSAFGAGRVLVGLDSGDSSFDTSEETGGSKTHTLITAEMPSHTHTMQTILRTATTGSDTTQLTETSDTSSTKDTTKGTDATGGGGAHNNLQPYIVVYFFKRTA